MAAYEIETGWTGVHWVARAWLNGAVIDEATGETKDAARAALDAGLKGGQRKTTRASSGPADRGMPKEIPDGAVASERIQIQPRTQQIPRPWVYYLAPGKDLRGWLSGNDRDIFSSGPHQVDPRRASSCVPVMPDILLARRTGNAYPPAYDGTTMNTTATWKEMVRVAHATHRLLAEHGSATKLQLQKRVKEALGAPFAAPNMVKKVNPTVTDALLDLRLYGLGTSDDLDTKNPTFVWVDPHTVSLADEV